MLAVTEIVPATLDHPRALRNRPKERGLGRWFKLEMVAHAGCQERCATKRIGGREFRIAPDRLFDRQER